MGNPVIVEAVRSPQGKRKGWFSGIHPAVLLGAAQVEVLKRSGIDPALVDEVIGGCVTQAGEQSNNMVRRAWLHAGLPIHTGSTVIDAQCPSAQQSTHFINALIKAGEIKVGIACGVESMTRIPLGTNVPAGFGFPKPDDWNIDMPDQFGGADRIAKARGFTREQLDAFGLRSQQLARAAQEAGRFEREIFSVEAPVLDDEGKPTGETQIVSQDQGIRDTSLEALANLKTVLEDGYHTAGTSSQISDGSSAILLMDEDVAKVARPQAARPHRRPAPRRRRSVLPPRRPGSGHREGSRDRRHDDERHRPGRSQRGVRLGRHVDGQPSTTSRTRSSTSTAAPSPSVTRSATPAPA